MRIIRGRMQIPTINTSLGSNLRIKMVRHPEMPEQILGEQTLEQDPVILM